LWDFFFQIPTKQRKIIPRNPMKEHAERRNPTSNQCEFHRDDTGYGHPKCIGGTQEIPKQPK
jgi:hypothetical protein